MFTHSLNPILFDFGFIAIRWYSLAYIFGVILGWWYGKKIIIKYFNSETVEINLKNFDDLITNLIFSIIIAVISINISNKKIIMFFLLFKIFEILLPIRIKIRFSNKRVWKINEDKKWFKKNVWDSE